MKVKRLAVISYHTCPLSDEEDAQIGGMNTYVLELSKILAEKGLFIDIFTRCEDTDSPKIVEVQKNLRVIHLPAGKLVNIPKKELLEYTDEFANNIQAFTEQENLKYDLISAHYYLSGLIGLELKKRYHIPLFVTFHTLALMKNLVARGEDEKEELQRIKAEILLAKKADKIIATSESDLEYIHTLYDAPLKKIALLSPGVNLKVFKATDKQEAKKVVKADLDHKIILYVGRIEPLKGLDVLLIAIKILVQRNPQLQFCLWIVGGTSSKEKLTEEVIRLNELKLLLGIHSYVKFVGQKNHTELPYYYSASEVVVMPSQYESFGMAALEAMACSVPVILTDVTGISNMLGKKHGPLLTSASNPILLAKKIKNLLINKEEHKKMSEEVFKKVQNLSWENIAYKFIQILN